MIKKIIKFNNNGDQQTNKKDTKIDKIMQTVGYAHIIMWNQLFFGYQTKQRHINYL